VTLNIEFCILNSDFPRDRFKPRSGDTFVVFHAHYSKLIFAYLKGVEGK